MTAKPRPPRYTHKSDRLITPGATAAEIRCDMACAPLDRAVRVMDDKYGVDRLVGLVSPATAEKYGRVMARLLAAYDAGNAELAATEAATAIRGLAAMDAEATAAGHQPADPRVWRIEIDGQRYGFVEDAAMVAIAERNNPGVKIVTLRQAVNSLAITENAVIAAAVQHFPGATVTAIRPRSQLAEELNDELPF